MTPGTFGAAGLKGKVERLCYPCCLQRASATGQAFVGNRVQDIGVCSCGDRAPLFEAKMLGIGRRLLDDDEQPHPRRRFSVIPGKARPDVNAVALLIVALFVVVFIFWKM